MRTSKRLGTFIDLATQFEINADGELVIRFGTVIEKDLESVFPGASANSSPSHSFPLDKRFIVSSSWKTLSLNELTVKVGEVFTCNEVILFPIPPIVIK